jgi:hypothetical protein
MNDKLREGAHVLVEVVQLFQYDRVSHWYQICLSQSINQSKQKEKTTTTNKNVTSFSQQFDFFAGFFGSNSLRSANKSIETEILWCGVTVANLNNCRDSRQSSANTERFECIACDRES